MTKKGWYNQMFVSIWNIVNYDSDECVFDTSWPILHNPL